MWFSKCVRVGVALALLLLGVSRVSSAAITVATLTKSSSSSAASSYTTASVSPTANRLNVVMVSTTGAAATAVSGASMTWVTVGTATLNAGVRFIAAFRALEASPGSGALTITSVGASNAEWNVLQFTGMLATGTSGADGIRANSGSLTANTGTFVSGTSTGCSANLAALGNSQNMSIGYMRVSTIPGTITPGTGYTRVGGLATDNAQAEYQVPGSATVDWTWTSTSTNAICASLEVVDAAAGVASPRTLMLLGVQ